MVKTYQVVILPQAVTSLRKITTFLRRTQSEKVERYVRKNILDSIRKLSTMPYSYKVLQEISTGDIIYRRSLQWSYRIIFAIYEDKGRVEVVDIDHGAEDPQKLVERFS